LSSWPAAAEEEDASKVRALARALLDLGSSSTASRIVSSGDLGAMARVLGEYSSTITTFFTRRSPDQLGLK
jgi:hypothetical protein